MLRGILPGAAAVAETRQDLVPDTLYAEEASVVAGAVEKRRREFITARCCARTALAELGLPPVAVPTGAQGAPQWPPGIVGSITHCEGYRACAVSRSTDLASIGIDAEPNEPLPEGLLPDIALAEERSWIRDFGHRAPGVSWDRVLFSIKESVYKAWFPLAGRWLGFEDAIVEIDRNRGRFAARLLVPGPDLGGREVTGFEGRWLACDDIVITAIAVPAVRSQ